jgi:hypothetical protein
MFQFLNRALRTRRSGTAQRRPLLVEALEARDLLSTLPVTHTLLAPPTPAVHAPHPGNPIDGMTSRCKIIAFKAIEQGDGIWTFTGKVIGGGTTGQTVQLGGLLSLKGRRATIADDGTFSITLRLHSGDDGTATAHTGSSNLARASVRMTTE